MLFSPRQVNAVYEIPDGNDSLGRDHATVDRCHMALGFGHDIRGRTPPPRHYRAKLMRDPLALDVSAGVPALPIAHIPAVPNTDDLPVLLSASH